MRNYAFVHHIESTKTYQIQIGSLLYRSLKTRLDKTFAVGKCSQFMTNPNESHFKTLDRIWAYLNKYPTRGICYDCRDIDIFAKIFCDSDWANNLDNRKSTEAFVTFIGNCPINWGSKLQKTVSCSSTEAEYMALTKAAHEGIYISNMLKWLRDKLGFFELQNESATILVDNLGALKLGENPSFHERTKHIDIAHHYIRDCIRQGITKVVHIPDKQQIADFLTKGLNLQKFN